MAAAESQHAKRQRLSEDGLAAAPPAAAAAAPAQADAGGGAAGEDGPAAAAPPAAAAAAPAQGEAAGGAAGTTSLVVIWDLDETLLVFNSLLTGAFAAATRRPEAAERLRALGARWERAILSMCDDRFFFEALEEYDQTCLADIQRHDDGASLAGYDFAADGFPPPPPQGASSQRSTPERHAAAVRPAPEPPAAAADGADGGQAATQPPGSPGGRRHLDAAGLTKLAYRYRRIVKLCTFGLAALGSAAQRREWEELYAETDAATGGWLSHASSLLAACSAQLAAAAGSGGGRVRVRHAAVTSGQLIPSLAKLLLFRLDAHIGAQHLWSSRYRGKQACFQLVRERYGPGCSYLVVGDGLEEDEAAAAHGLPYVRVLLAPAAHYPPDRVASWRPEAATGGAGLPFTQLTLGHLAAAAGLSVHGGAAGAAEAAAAGGGLAPRISEGHGRGSSAALEALAASSGSSEEEAGSGGDGGAA